LATREKLFGKGHVQTAPSYVLIARVRAYNERAEQCLRQAMRLYQKIDPEHAELAEAWSQLGRHQRIRENYDDAEQTLEHALKHWRRLDPDHPRAAATLVELGMVRAHQQKIDEAQRLYGEALKRHFSSLSDASLCSYFQQVHTAADVTWPDGAPR